MFNSNTHSKADFLFLILILLIGIFLQAHFLSQPMRYDESFTFLNFVHADFRSLFYYPLPNNHVLYTLLERLSILLFGIQPVFLRLPAYLAGISAIPIIFVLCRKLIPGNSGLFASALTAICPYLVLYSTNARGYSLVVLLSLLLTLLGYNYCLKPDSKKALALGAIAALGMLTIPSMLLSIVGVYLWITCLLFLQKRSISFITGRFLFPVGLSTLICTCILYLPTVIITGGVAPILENRFVRPSPWHTFITNIGPHFRAIISDFTRDVPIFISCIIILAIIIGFIQSIRKKNFALLLLLPSIVLGSMLVIFAKHRVPYVRTWIFLIPYIFIAADAGFTFFIEKLKRNGQYILQCSVIVFMMFYSFVLISHNAIEKYPDTGVFPEASAVAKKLVPLLHSNDKILAKTPTDWPLNFYLWYTYYKEEKTPKMSSARSTYILVRKDTGTLSYFTKKPTVKVFDMKDVVLYKIVNSE